MNNEVNNINSSVQPNTPVTLDPNVNQVPTAQPGQVSQNVVNTMSGVTPTAQSVSQTVTPTETSSTVQNTNNTDPMSAVANLNKDEAMEEALSHTTQYSPFEASKQEVNQEVKKENNKSAYIFIGIIFAIMLLFIIFLPQISNLFGWV